MVGTQVEWRAHILSKGGNNSSVKHEYEYSDDRSSRFLYGISWFLNIAD